MADDARLVGFCPQLLLLEARVDVVEGKVVLVFRGGPSCRSRESSHPGSGDRQGMTSRGDFRVLCQQVLIAPGASPRQLFGFFRLYRIQHLILHRMTPITIVLVHKPKNEKYLYFWKVADAPRKLYTVSVLGSPLSDLFNSLTGLLEMMSARGAAMFENIWSTHVMGLPRRASQKRCSKYQKFQNTSKHFVFGINRVHSLRYIYI